ncbi:DUF4184 family protein [Promicromonospora thailandica]|uniref:Uncharacterized protein n=1 Tax=Promicromonospora thailandica TaxID=765201 RepID=A0A9X2JX88_9MICO|nr:DUF4184 family protein [Promicromonospora thailandica]MCP2266986.1 protein of unknown function (DUF4184) [Promicromonospora thailandica]BFF16739.1 hypothetical protein GCM10025730_02600 [Promicromonospora thailandica]
MPFTLSHPAAVLPLLRHPFSTVALVAGAMAPDLPYFARRTPVPVSAQSWYEPFMNATTSHGLVGALTVSLPYALALCGLYWVARRPVEALLPVRSGRPGRGMAGGGPGAANGERTADGGHPAGDGSPPSGAVRAPGAGAIGRRAGWVLLSLLIGIATHLVWDSFTHSDGYVVLHVPALSEPLAGGLTWARALQHASTVGGLALVAWYLWRRRERLSARTVPARVVWPTVGVAAVGAVAGTLDLWGDTGLTTGQTIEAVLAGAATGAGAALIVGLFVYVVAWWAVRGRAGRRDEPSGSEANRGGSERRPAVGREGRAGRDRRIR